MKRIAKIAETYRQLQIEICSDLEDADGKGKFSRNHWKKEIGGGTTAVLQNGAIIEKGAVNFSFVKGNYSPRMEKLLGEKAQYYAATGISSILHPENPWMPIIHMNVRYFALDNGISWFGGGIDLTPHIIEPEDAAEFHAALKATCDQFDSRFYPDYKKWADDYYFLPHRNETRGVGGIFFDRLKFSNSEEFEKLFNFTVALSQLYPVVYTGFMKSTAIVLIRNVKKTGRHCAVVAMWNSTWYTTVAQNSDWNLAETPSPFWPVCQPMQHGNIITHPSRAVSRKKP
jgi:coproporphyrinogen III oxidase